MERTPKIHRSRLEPIAEELVTGLPHLVSFDSPSSHQKIPRMPATMLSALAAVTLLLGLPIGAAAQAKSDSGAFVVRRGRDTVATERFTRTASHLEGTLA